MNESDLNAYRAKRLADLLRERFDGNKVALGKALGYSSGAFVRQMIDGERAVTEKTVLKIHALHGCKGWMDLPAAQTTTTSVAAERARNAYDPLPFRLTRSITELMEGLDPLVAPSAKETIRKLLDGELTERQAADDLTRLQAMSAATMQTKRTGTG
jgi:hypothetical protein